MQQGQTLPFAATRFFAATLQTNKNPTELVAEGGLGGVLYLGPDVRCQTTVTPPEPRPSRFCKPQNPGRYSSCAAIAVRLIADGTDKAMPPAAKACARVFLGIDGFIATMIEPSGP